MLSEISVYEKLNTLQEEMRRFHEQISPVKARKPDKYQLPQYESSKLLSTFISVTSISLKIFACMVGPTVFPAIVYCVEGSSQLFWQITVISCMITLLLAMMTVCLLCTSAKNVKDKIKDVFHMLNTVLSGIGPFRFLSESLTSDFVRMNLHKILYPFALLLISCLVSYMAYARNLWIVFYSSLVTAGFLFGILTATLCDMLKSPELLPFHSPCKIKMAFTPASPEVKKELKFGSYSQRNPTTAPTAMMPNENTRAETQNMASMLPNYSRSINHEEMKYFYSKVYQLPINFSSFFRRYNS